MNVREAHLRARDTRACAHVMTASATSPPAYLGRRAYLSHTQHSPLPNPFAIHPTTPMFLPTASHRMSTSSFSLTQTSLTSARSPMRSRMYVLQARASSHTRRHTILRNPHVMICRDTRPRGLHTRADACTDTRRQVRDLFWLGPLLMPRRPRLTLILLKRATPACRSRRSPPPGLSSPLLCPRPGTSFPGRSLLNVALTPQVIIRARLVQAIHHIQALVSPPASCFSLCKPRSKYHSFLTIQHIHISFLPPVWPQRPRVFHAPRIPHGADVHGRRPSVENTLRRFRCLHPRTSASIPAIRMPT